MAGSKWVSHLPLVMLGLQTAPKDNSSFSPAEAVYGTNLSLPGEFIKHSGFPPEVFLLKVEHAISGFFGPPCHHMTPPQPKPLPQDLLTAEFVFVQDNASKPQLSPLYRGPYKVLKRFEKDFILQIGDKSDSVSVDGLKDVFSSVPGASLSASSLRRSASCSCPREEDEGSVQDSCSSYEAPPESSLDGLRFSASLRRPLASPSGRSNCGY